MGRFFGSGLKFCGWVCSLFPIAKYIELLRLDRTKVTDSSDCVEADAYFADRARRFIL